MEQYLACIAKLSETHIKRINDTVYVQAHKAPQGNYLQATCRQGRNCLNSWSQCKETHPMWYYIFPLFKTAGFKNW